METERSDCSGAVYPPGDRSASSILLFPLRQGAQFEMNKLTTLLLDRVAAWVCGRDLWASAQEWVALYERKDLPGEEKRERVLNAILAEFAALGQDLAASLIGFAIEAAVQYLRRRAG